MWNFEFVGQAATALSALAGLWWGYEKWRRRDEHFPRVNFEVSANFLGFHNDHVVTELVALLENKGVVPLKIRDFTFKLRGLRPKDAGGKGPPEIRGQLEFPHVVGSGVFVPSDWDYSFVYPGVKTEYNYVTVVPLDFAFLRIQSDFAYMDRDGTSHHAAKVLRVPQRDDRGHQVATADT